MIRVANSAASLGVFILLWAAFVQFSGVPNYLVPSPLAVGTTLWQVISDGSIFKHIFTTVFTAGVGYLIGAGVGLLIGSLLAEFSIADKLIRPYLVGLQSIPKVALAPLLIVWFGYGLEGKIVLVVLMTFFPVFVNTVAGLHTANKELIDLYRASSASRLRIFSEVKLPTAASAVFAGLEVAVVLALIGTIVAEFVSAKAGLGYLVQVSSTNYDVPMMFAAITILAMLGIASSKLLRFAHMRLVFWEGPRRNNDY